MRSFFIELTVAINPSSTLYVFPIALGQAVVAQLVEVLRYKPEGRGFDSRWCHWNFSLT
jgi:hypothetical protein